jgi:hypothetical protein
MMMQPRELFGVIVRTGGLVLLALSMVGLVHVVAHLTGLTRIQDLIVTCFYFALGIALTRGADWIVRFV